MMTQRKTSTQMNDDRNVNRRKARNLSAAMRREFAYRRILAARYQEALLHDSSTPGPIARRSTDEPRLDPAEIHDRHNRIRMWSYKGAGIESGK